MSNDKARAGPYQQHASLTYPRRTPPHSATQHQLLSPNESGYLASIEPILSPYIFNEVIFIFNKIYDAKDVTIQNHFAELVMILINDYIPFPVPFGPWEMAISTLQVVSDLFGKEFNKLTYINDYELDGAMIDEIIAYHQQLIQN
jgi:hypothetical protein